MGLIPSIAKYIPQKLCRFCEGLRYPPILALNLAILSFLADPAPGDHGSDHYPPQNQGNGPGKILGGHAVQPQAQ